MEYYSTTQNHVEKEEGELSSSDDDDDDDKGNTISERAHSAHTVQLHTEREVILSADQPIIDEMSEIFVIDEWTLSDACDKENQPASSNKTNQFTSSNKVYKTSDSNNRNNSTVSNKGNQSCASNKWDKSSAKCEKSTPDPRYDTSRNSPQDKNYPNCQKSTKELKRRFTVAGDQSQPSRKYRKPANTVWNKLNLDPVKKISSGDEGIAGDLRNEIRRLTDKSENYPSFGEAEEQAKRWNALSDGNRSMISKHNSATRQTSNYRKILSRTLGKFSSVQKFNLLKYEKLRYRRTPSVRPASKNQTLHTQAESQGQREVVRNVKKHFDQPMRKSNQSNPNSQLDGSFHEHWRERFIDSPHLTSPQMYDSGYTTHDDYPSQDSNLSYTPTQSSPHGIPAVRSTQRLPVYHNNRSNVSPSYPHAVPYQHQPAPMLVAAPALMLATASGPVLVTAPGPVLATAPGSMPSTVSRVILVRTPPRKLNSGSLSDDIGQKLHSIRFNEFNQFPSQNTFSGNIQDCESTSAMNSSHFNPQVVSSTSHYSSKILAIGSDVSTSVFHRLGPHVANCPAGIQTGLDGEYPAASFSDSTKTFSNREQFSFDSARGRNATNLITVAAASKPVSGGGPNRRVNDSIMQKNLTKNLTGESKQDLLERLNNLTAKIKEMKARNCVSSAVQKSRFKIDRTSNAKSQSVYKIDKRAVPDCSAENYNLYNVTLEEKENTNLLCSVLPQTNKETAANVNLESSLPEAQTVPTESQAEPKANEMERRHVVYSSPLRMFEYYRNKQADKKITETTNEKGLASLADTQEDCDRHVTTMESTEINNDSPMTSQTKKQETYVKYALAMESTEENYESHITSPVETQEDCERYVSIMEITDTNDERHVLIKAETQEDCGKHILAMESTCANNDSHVASSRETKEDWDKHASVMERFETNDESHVTSPVKTQETCDKHAVVIGSTEANKSNVTSSEETQEICDKHALDTGNTEVNDENCVMGPIEAQKSWDKNSSAKESTEANYQSRVRGPVETQEDHERHVSLMESSETNEENHEIVKAEVQEDWNRHFSVMENTEAIDESPVLIKAEKLEDCGKHVTGMESTKADDESHVASPVETLEICDKHASTMESTEENDESHVKCPAEIQENCYTHVTAMESTKADDESHVMIPVETQENCDRHVTAMECTDTHDDSHVMIKAEVQKD